MADANDLLTQINKRFDAIEKNMATKSDLQEVKQSRAQINTALEALAAGQKEQATKADIHRLEQKIDRVAKDVKSHASRIENLGDTQKHPTLTKINPVLPLTSAIFPGC